MANLAINQPLAQTRKKDLILGMGKTGVSVARYLQKNTQPFAMADDREQLPIEQTLRDEFPEAQLMLGNIGQIDLQQYGRVILSPGVPRSTPIVQQAVDAGMEVVGDIELFATRTHQPVIAITGSNGKSTVAHLVNTMLADAGFETRLGGNFGTPALDLLQAQEPDCYVLELSSFQLESLRSLKPKSAVVLNVSEDHLDRYADILDYARTKGRIYCDANAVVINRQDVLANQWAPYGKPTISFGTDEPAEGQYGLREIDGSVWLAKGDSHLLATSELKLYGRHNWLNILAALALCDSMSVPVDSLVNTLRNYTGLAHRLQWVSTINQVTWLNDSKATNPGAAQAALEGIDEHVVLIAGGQGKGADFSSLREIVSKKVRAVVLIGEDADLIEKAWKGAVAMTHADSMDQAVEAASNLAQVGDHVLLSPACASFDMFTGYEQRGEKFAAAVKKLKGAH